MNLLDFASQSKPSLAEQAFGKERAEELRQQARLKRQPSTYWLRAPLPPSHCPPTPRPQAKCCCQELRQLLLSLLAEDLGELVGVLLREGKP